MPKNVTKITPTQLTRPTLVGKLKTGRQVPRSNFANRDFLASIEKRTKSTSDVLEAIAILAKRARTEDARSLQTKREMSCDAYALTLRLNEDMDAKVAFCELPFFKEQKRPPKPTDKAQKRLRDVLHFVLRNSKKASRWSKPMAEAIADRLPRDEVMAILKADARKQTGTRKVKRSTVISKVIQLTRRTCTVVLKPSESIRLSNKSAAQFRVSARIINGMRSKR